MRARGKGGVGFLKSVIKWCVMYAVSAMSVQKLFLCVSVCMCVCVWRGGEVKESNILKYVKAIVAIKDTSPVLSLFFVCLVFGSHSVVCPRLYSTRSKSTAVTY